MLGRCNPSPCSMRIHWIAFVGIASGLQGRRQRALDGQEVPPGHELAPGWSPAGERRRSDGGGPCTGQRAPPAVLGHGRLGSHRDRARLCQSGPRRRLQLAQPPHGARRAPTGAGGEPRPSGALADPAARARLEREDRHQPQLRGRGADYGPGAAQALRHHPRSRDHSMQAISGAGYPGVASMDIMANVIPFIGGEKRRSSRRRRRSSASTRATTSSRWRRASRRTATACRWWTGTW